MNTGFILEAAQQLTQAAQEASQSRSELHAAIEQKTSQWEGNRKKKFDSMHQQVLSEYGHYSHRLYEMADQMRALAQKVEEVTEHIRREEEARLKKMKEGGR